MMNHGVLNLLKPPGMTSHDAVAQVRRVLKTKRVGHTGTLDPAAAGVLPICVGLATRLVETLQAGTKEYLAEATFGFETDTLDAVGEVIRECNASQITLEQLEKACENFRGEISQQPPMHSAIKIGGEKLYEIARKGGDIEIPSRPVTISTLEVTRFLAGDSGSRTRAFLRIECSGGTYIRSLVRDIGRQLDNAATMTFLSRVRSGAFSLADTLTFEEFEASLQLVPLLEILQQHYGSARVDEEVVNSLWHGQTVRAPSAALHNTQATERPVLWSNSAKNLLALAQYQGDEHWKPVRVFDLRA